MKAEQRHVLWGNANKQALAVPWRRGAMAQFHTAHSAQRAKMTSEMPTAMVTK